MPGQIAIRRLKHIRELIFDIPGPGVHLLAGVNGAGKTSLLACLRRIGQRQAFAQHFATSQHSKSLDNFEDAEIRYSLGQDQVTYSYGGERWVPRPRAQNGLLAQFGYPDVFYIGATADRITPRPEDFLPRRARLAPAELRDVANQILDTQKFNALHTINLTRGAGNPAFLLQASPPPGAKYYSEKNFSLGELCILKLVRALRDCANNSLLLIDELELALHPRAQVKLLEYLTHMSARKQLTVIFSTHSASLLKRVSRKQIFFLENDNGKIRTLRGCYPTYALGSIAYDEERSPDIVIYVEDDAALHSTEVLVRLCISRRFAAGPAYFPTVHVVPIGSFINVVRYLSRAQAQLPSTTRVYALLDQDVSTETIQQWRADRNHERLAEFQQFEGMINYLPWTPEVGLIDFLRQPQANAIQLLRAHYFNNVLTVPHALFQDVVAAPGPEQRRTCKTAVARVSAHVAEFLPNVSAEEVRKALHEVFAKWYFDHNGNAAMGLIAPLIA